MKTILAAAVLAVLTFAGSASAESYKFHLYNRSTKYPIIGFETYEDGKWSKWENVNLAPGEDELMDWNSSEGDCVVPFKILYSNIETEQYSVDWCKVHNIYVSDSDVTFD